MDQTISPAVLTSSAATDHINNVVQPAVDSANAGMAAQNSNQPFIPQNSNGSPDYASVGQTSQAYQNTGTGNSTTTTPTTSATNTPLNTYSYVSTDGTTKNVQGTNPADAMTKAGDIASHSGVQQVQAPVTTQVSPTSSSTSTTTPASTSTTDTGSSSLSDSQTAMKQMQAANDAVNQKFSDALASITNGTTPLTPAEQSQVTALQNQYSQLIAQQTGVNKGAVGSANIYGYSSGAAEYDPYYQASTISAIAAAGAQKLAGLFSQEASAVGALSKSLQQQDYDNIKSQWDELQGIQDKKQTQLQKTIDDTQAAIQKAQDDQQKVIDSVNDIATQAAKNGADPKTLMAITSSGTEADAITAAADYLQTATGTQGDYLLYTRQAKAAGQVPVSYNDYLTMDANRKLPTASSSGSSSSSGSQSDVDMIAQGIIDGNQPPTTTGLYGKTAAVRAALEAKGYDLTSANQDWTATQKLLSTLNGAQQVRLRQAVDQVGDSLDLAQSLADQWNGGGFPALNSAVLASAKAGALGADAQSLATRLDAQIADLTSELGTVYKGGNSSTDESLKLAAQNLQSNWSQQTFDDAVALAKQNIQIRKNSLNLTTAGITDSEYNPTTSALLQQGATDPLNITPAGADTSNNPLGI